MEDITDIKVNLLIIYCLPLSTHLSLLLLAIVAAFIIFSYF